MTAGLVVVAYFMVGLGVGCAIYEQELCALEHGEGKALSLMTHVSLVAAFWPLIVLGLIGFRLGRI